MPIIVKVGGLNLVGVGPVVEMGLLRAQERKVAWCNAEGTTLRCDDRSREIKTLSSAASMANRASFIFYISR